MNKLHNIDTSKGHIRTIEKGGDGQGSYQGARGFEGRAKDRICIKKVFTAFKAGGPCLLEKLGPVLLSMILDPSIGPGEEFYEGVPKNGGKKDR